MRDTLVVVEDAAYRQFLPLAHTRPVYELISGAMSLRERIERYVGSAARLYCRGYLAEVTAEATGRPVNAERLPKRPPVLFVNGRLLNPRALDGALETSGEIAAWWNGSRLVAARLTAEAAQDLLLTLESNDWVFESGMLPKLPRRLIAGPLANYPWELVLQNGDRITEDVRLFGWSDVDRGGARAGVPQMPRGVHVLGDDVIVAPGARLEPTVVLDSTSGPIIIGRGAHVLAHTRIEGPAAIAAGARIVGGKIRAGTTIGPGCRVGGEVEASIFHARSNKYHDGFLGHSYVGEWVNLGAMTTNSDLKNTYGPVKLWNDGKLLQTAESKIGALIGDHTKTGIGTLIDTGTVIGIAANIFGGGLARAKFVPSFSWGNPPDLDVYDPERCMSTMQTVMARRDVELTPAYHEMIDELIILTENERVFSGIGDDT
jgi:UDP-N-acetylglucosamine diphosphorylase/glucosamine-1-phosphate N-acetyltransferase